MSAPLSKRGAKLSAVAKLALLAGMKIVATQPRSKVPDTRFCPRGADSATDSLAEVKAWLRADDQINLGAVLKGSNILAVDVDGPAGNTALRKLTDLPPTRKTKTRNGSHRFYRYEGDLGGSVIKLAPDLDIIMSGYVLLAGAQHPDGGTYSSGDFSVPIARVPQKLIKAIKNHRDSKKLSPQKPRSKGKIVKGYRNDRLASIAGAFRRQGYDEEQIYIILESFNEHFCQPPLGRREVERIANSISRYSPEDEDLFTLMADVTPRDVSFLWKPYFVRGAVNLLEGDSNVGKTFFLCWLAALISSGKTLPGQDKMPPQGVLFLSAEDDPETTLVKRFKRMGADLNRIWTMKKYLRLNEDTISVIEKHIVENGVSVVMIDPLHAYMQGLDMNKANETRPFMARLAELAKERNVTVVGLRHLNKSDKDKAIHRGLGSVDITAASRSAVMIGLHPEDEDIRVLVHIKHNLSVRGDSRLYTLQGATETRVPKLEWAGISDLTADDLARKPNRVGRPSDASEEAMKFLTQALASGAKPAAQVIREGERRSINPSTLRKVARRMGVNKEKRTWKLAENTL